MRPEYQQFINTEEAVPFPVITGVAKYTSAEIRRGSKIYAAQMQNAWDTLLSSSEITNDGLILTHHGIDTFWHDGINAKNTIKSNNINILSNLAWSRRKENPQWRSFGVFLMHDIHWLEPSSAYYQIFMTFDVMAHNNRRLCLLPRHVEHMEEAVHRSAELGALSAFPVDFLLATAQIYENIPIKTELFDVYSALEPITLLLKGLYPQDYIAVTSPDDGIGQNRFVLDIPKDSYLHANKGAYFCSIYNLINNAARAIAKDLDRRNDGSFFDSYMDGKAMQNPKSIYIQVNETATEHIVRVHDDGPGIPKLPIGENVFDYLGKPNIPALYDPNEYRGQGLHILRHGVSILNGTIYGTNKPEAGAEFTITIPK